MTVATIYCVSCGKVVPTHGQLKPCLKCGGVEFTTRPEFDQAITYNDRRFLRSLRIAAPPKPIREEQP